MHNWLRKKKKKSKIQEKRKGKINKIIIDTKQRKKGYCADKKFFLRKERGL